MNDLDLLRIEKELKKRHRYPYTWFRKQNDEWDHHTQFIYKTTHWESLLQKITLVAESKGLNHRHIFQYAVNRWYNFWSAKAVEQIFTAVDGIEPVANAKDAEKDFYLFGIPFDHKTSVYPKKFGKPFEYAQSHKAELIEWLYKNQSTQKRHHLKNRLFLVVYNKNGDHWRLKAEISLLQKAIHKYMADYKPEQLHSFIFDGINTSSSDIIWVSK